MPVSAAHHLGPPGQHEGGAEVAMIRMTAAEARRAARVDRKRVAETTDEAISQHALQDGEDPEGYRDWHPTPARLRAELGLTQVEIAEALVVPIATWRNWEQGRVALDPAVRALLRVVGRATRGLPVLLGTLEA